MEDTLLTKEERDEAFDGLPSNRTVGDERIVLCKAQAAKALKAVGKWLEMRKGRGISDYALMGEDEIATLLLGEMPE